MVKMKRLLLLLVAAAVIHTATAGTTISYVGGSPVLFPINFAIEPIPPTISGIPPDSWTGTGPGDAFAPGLSVNPITGVISGTPTALISPAITYTINAFVNATMETPSTTIQIEVYDNTTTTTSAPMSTTMAPTPVPAPTAALSTVAIVFLVLGIVLALFLVCMLNEQQRYRRIRK